MKSLYNFGKYICFKYDFNNSFNRRSSTKQWKRIRSLRNELYLTLIVTRWREKRKGESNISCDSFAIWYTFSYEKVKKRKGRERVWWNESEKGCQIRGFSSSRWMIDNGWELQARISRRCIILDRRISWGNHEQSYHKLLGAPLPSSDKMTLIFRPGKVQTNWSCSVSFLLESIYMFFSFFENSKTREGVEIFNLI